MKFKVVILFVLFLVIDIGFSQNWTIYSSSNSSLPDNNVKCTVIDANGHKWFATYGGGLAEFDGDTTWVIYDPTNSGIPSKDLNYLMLDGTDLWIGTQGAGISRYDGTNWITYTRLNSNYPGIGANCMAKDPNGWIWATTTYHLGVGVFDGNSWTKFTNANSGLPDDNVNCIAVDMNGDKWIGTLYGGVVRLSDTVWTAYNTTNSNLPSNDVSAVAVDHQNNVWVGFSWDGIAKFDGDTTWTFYNSGNSPLHGDRITRLFVDDDGNLWIGAFDGGIAKFDGDTTWTLYNPNVGGLPGWSIESIFIENETTVWFGIRQVGMVRGNLTTPIDKFSFPKPQNFVLQQNYPNPFNPVTRIVYYLPTRSPVKLSIYNMIGEEIAVLVNDIQPPGKYQIVWDASDNSSGIYFCQLRVGKQRQTRKMIYLR